MAMILGTGWWFVHTGMHEGTLLGVLITGGVQIGQSIAGMQTKNLPQIPQVPQEPQLPQQQATP